jgi:hypothetical protein
MESDCCAICLEVLEFNNRKLHITECNHKFHRICFQKIIGNQCPCCRGTIMRDMNSLKYEAKKKMKDLKVQFKKEKKDLNAVMFLSKKKIKQSITYLKLTSDELNILVKSDLILRNATLLMKKTDMIHVLTTDIYKEKLFLDKTHTRYLECLEKYNYKCTQYSLS